MLGTTHDCRSLLCGRQGGGIQVVQELLSCPPQRWELVSGYEFRQLRLVHLSAPHQLLLLKELCNDRHLVWLPPLFEFPEKGKSTALHYAEMGSYIPQRTARENTHTLLHGVGVEDMYVGEEWRGKERRGEERTHSCFRFIFSRCSCCRCLIVAMPWACRDSLICLCCCSFFWPFALALLCWTRKLS